MKKLTFALALLAITSLSTSAFAQANEDWLDKDMGFGIGAGSEVVAGNPGLSVRFFPVEVFGLELVLGGGTDRTVVTTPAQSATVPELKTISRTSRFDVTLYSDFRFLRSNRSALSAYLGLGIANHGAAESFPVTTGPVASNVTGTDSVTDFAVELGLRGEIFLYKFFSVHGRVGININPYTDNEAPNVTDPQQPPQPVTGLEPSTGGANIRIFDRGNLLGQFGFTCWFN